MVTDGEKVLAQKDIVLEKVLSDSIIPAIDKILSQAKVLLPKLDGFCVGLGPGSFTSLRVGLSTIKGLAFALKKPVVGISSLDGLAMNVKEDADILTVVDAKRNLFYTCFYQKKGIALKRKSKYLLLSADEVLKVMKPGMILVGDGVGLLQDKIARESGVVLADPDNWYPKAENLALLSLERFKKKDFDNISTLVPLYLYPEDCQVQK
ncbi:MAG: tRNA (adenosine(37)-N6)-threonylcarbamoyltransferase complex dimerization subunit type 1 TsaB [Omnitrophica WOR_2 bacterium GWA2_47_8]|nr:MAG: tRNA (adenosine(37)-N6)-threonylcarbamoyltransferase complex dimerization subunit type 1 TsaB [Omnitrophica WOR_2 bacterium GWA2_47_8]